jgi:hypothetical protein
MPRVDVLPAIAEAQAPHDGAAVTVMGDILIGIKHADDAPEKPSTKLATST